MVRKTRKTTKKHYDFIEIGTSDFNTLIQKATASTVGLSVEPMTNYLEKLPDKPHVIKVNAAVSDKTGKMEIYYVPNDVREKYGLPNWMKGTNKVGAPHPTVMRYLKKHNLPESLMRKQTVPVLSVRKLLSDYKVGSIGLLKIDTEGHDIVILRAYLKLAQTYPSLRAAKIIFESNALSSRAEVAEMVHELEILGYLIETRRQDTIATLV